MTLDERIEIQSPVRTAEADGSFVTSWEHFESAWAKVEPLQWRESEFSGQTQAIAEHRVTIRFLDGVVEGQRIIRDNGMPFEVLRVAPTGTRRSWLQLLIKKDVRQ